MDHDSTVERLATARIFLNDLTIEDWQAHSAILKERTLQLAQGWTPQHDDWHSVSGWVSLLAERLGTIAAADRFDGPLTLADDASREQCQQAAIQLAALAWAMLAASYRGDLYASGERAIEPDDVPKLQLFEVRFWYDADGARHLSDGYRIVTRSVADAFDYAQKFIAPTFPHPIAKMECDDDVRGFVYVAPQP